MARTMEGDHSSCGVLIEAIARDCAANRKEIVSVDKRLNETNRLLSGLSCEVSHQRHHLSVLSDTVADIKDVVESTNLRVIKLEGEQAETNTRLTSLETGQAETNTRLTSLETAQAETNTRLTSLETAQAETNTRLRSLETGQAETNTRLDRVDSRLGGMDSRMDGMDARMDRMDTRLNRIEATQMEHSGLLARILTSVESLAKTKSSEA